ncbi:MAG: polymer-forming cytoskeletal protein [Catalinimonas sp.]
MFSSNNNKEPRRDARQPEGSDLSNHIQKGTTITGDVETVGNIRIDGRVIGNVRSKARVVFGDSAHMEGDVHAQNAEVQGYIKGKMEVGEMLTLKPTAKIDGDIYTNKMLVEAGAVFNGGCHMGVKVKEVTIDGDKQPQQPARVNGAPAGRKEKVTA